MKKALWFSLLAVPLVTATLFAVGNDFLFQAEKKRTGVERTQTTAIQTSEEHWAYHVSISNHSFKDVPKAEARYVFFAKTEVPGSKTGQAKEARKAGTAKSENFKSNTKWEFDTEEAELTKTQLMGGYTWGNGAKGRARASLTGIWVRLYQDGKMLAEFSEPEGLKTKEKWQ